MRDTLREFRHALRRLGRAPLFTSIAIVTLAVGIGANAAIFSVVDGVLLKPLPFDRPDELVQVWHRAPGFNASNIPLSEAAYFTYRSDSRVFESIGLATENEVTLRSGTAEPERVAAMVVTASTLPMLGVAPVAGQLFGPEEDAPGAPRTALLDYGYWQRRFGGSPAVLGQDLTVDGVPYQIFGVLPRGFRLRDRAVALYLPARLDPAAARMYSFNYEAIARLRPGVTIAQANADVDRMLPIAADRHPGGITREQLEEVGFGGDLRPLKESLVGDVSTVLWVLVGTVGLVLLLACANVANLFMVQAEGRQREVAVRTALGASRQRIIGAFITESLVLGGVAGLLGVGLAYGGLRLLVAIGPSTLPRMGEIGIDGRVLIFTLGVSVLAGLLFGLAPAFKYGRPDLIAGLKEGGRGSSSGRDRYRARNGLVVVQVALALVLLIGSGLMIRSVQSLRGVDPGFARPEEVLTFRIYVPPAEVPEATRVAQMTRQILDRMGEVSGVTSVGATSAIAIGHGLTSANPVVAEDRPLAPGEVPSPRRYLFVTPDYPRTLLTPLVAGRFFTWDDIDAGARVVLVSEGTARDLWGDPVLAVGRRIRDFVTGPEAADPIWYEVVGVVGDVRDDGVTQPAPSIVYWPYTLAHFWGESPFVPRSLDLAVRTAGPPAAQLARFRDAVWSVSASLPLANIRTLAEILRTSMARASFAMVMLSIAAVVALVLGLVGIYGVVSYIVTQRTREIGVRIALGAPPARVRRMVIGQAAVVAVIGIAIGLAAAAALTRLMAGLLHGVRPVDPVTYGAVALVIAGVAVLASWVPARRAAGIDPATALRAD